MFPFPFTLNGIWSWWQFSFRFEPNGIPFGSKSKWKLSPRSYPIQFERKWKFISEIGTETFGVISADFQIKDWSKPSFRWVMSQIQIAMFWPHFKNIKQFLYAFSATPRDTDFRLLSNWSNFKIWSQRQCSPQLKSKKNTIEYLKREAQIIEIRSYVIASDWLLA